MDHHYVNKPLEIIFKCFESMTFLLKWKKANVVPVHKWWQIMSANYRPISLLPKYRKIFERLLYNKMSDFFITNHFISTNQLGFKPGDSWIDQLLSMEYKRPLIKNMQLVVCFLTFQRDFIRFGMKVSSLSKSKMEYLANCYVS